MCESSNIVFEWSLHSYLSEHTGTLFQRSLLHTDPCLCIHLSQETGTFMNKKCFCKWAVMFLHHILSLDHSSWSSREINWNNIRRKSHYSWRKRDIWPNCCWRMAWKSKTIQIMQPFMISDHPKSPIMHCTVPFIVLPHGQNDFGWFTNTCDSYISQASSSAAQKETLPRSPAGQDRGPDSQPGAHGGFTWYYS